jgi:hypothetical protein
VIHYLPPNRSVIQSVAFPPHAKGSMMPRIDIPLDPSQALIMHNGAKKTCGNEQICTA